MTDLVGIGLGALLGGAVAGLSVWALGRWHRTHRERPGSSSSPDARPPGPVPTGVDSPQTEGLPADRSEPVRSSVDPDVRLSRRIVLHLARQPRIAPDDIALPEHTQGGIGTAVGGSQSSVAKVLRRLVAAGVVTEDRRHVRGLDRRLKVYVLSPRGETLARDLRSRSVRPNGSKRGPGGL